MLHWCNGMLFVVMVVAASAAEGPRDREGRPIQRLEWTSPRGELPGTMAAYLRRHPLTPARLTDVATYGGPARLRDGGGPRLSILVDAGLYPQISAAVSGYVTDLVDEGYVVEVDTVSGGTPAEIKAWVAGQYAAGSEGMVFVGDITAAWAEVSGSVFPCDLYYQDLDGVWMDSDGDGDFDGHEAGAGDEGPEVYLARLYAHTLSYDSEANMTAGYLNKAHAYRAGGLVQPWRGLEYIDKDWFSLEVGVDRVFGDDVVRHDYGHWTTAADYLAQMALGQHFVHVCAHSFSGGHHFSRYPTESAAYAHVYVYSPATRPARLLLGADDGIKAWLNGSVVCVHDVSDEWVADAYSHAVTLHAGWNTLLCKISQLSWEYEFSARFTDLNGQTLDDLQYQLSDPDVHPPDAPFIRKWLVNGFHQDVSDNFWNFITTNYLGVSEASINPNAGDVMGGQTWTVRTTAGDVLDFQDQGDNDDYGCSYAFVRVYADAPRLCMLRLGYDDGVRAWLNGVEVARDNRTGGLVTDMLVTGVMLNAGENRLLVKVTEWMGEHGLAARFTNGSGTPVEGLTYDPAPDPASFIGTWLLNGPYVNPDPATRLTQDYLGGEAGVRPSAGDAAPLNTWERSSSGAEPVKVGEHFDGDGGWIYSQTIQDHDPPVLFYNLFACGPGRFTDADYLAGSYIFNTSYGLITVASAKSGSMLNFADFTTPLAGQTIGQAYLAWFDAQAPFAQWEREWYYGMVLNGDPTLRVVRKGDIDRNGRIDADDLAALCACMAGPGRVPTPTQPGGTVNDCLRAFDFDQDDDVDLADARAFERFFGVGL